jgi:hypothetical protein
MSTKETSLNATIAKGQFVRNGGNRHFCITNLTDTTITLEEYTAHGPSDRPLNLSREVFVKLYARKNYVPVRFFKSLKTGRWMERRDWETERIIGANRLIVKQTYPNR